MITERVWIPVTDAKGLGILTRSLLWREIFMDRVILAGCVGLFLAGGLFSYAAFYSTPSKSITLIDCFSVLSAVATAIAAVASWRAASAARKQSFDTATSNRRQLYRMHFESFNDWLNGVEADAKVSFYRRHELYETIFPSNRNPELPFTEKSDPEIESWAKSFRELTDLACSLNEIDRRSVEGWVMSYTRQSGHMRFTAVPVDRDQIRLGGVIATGISKENYKDVLPVMGKVLASLSGFAFLEGTSSDRGMTETFQKAFIDLVDAVQIHQWHQHQYS